MVKRLVFIVLFIVMASSLVFAQDADETVGEEEKPEFNYTTGIVVGLTSFENFSGQHNGYQRLGYLPEFSYGKWRFGFQFIFDFDGDFKLRDLNEDGKADTWSTFYDYLYKLSFVEYAQPGDAIHGYLGEYSDYDLGYGMLAQGFNNTLFYPYILQRGLLFDFDARAVEFPYIGVETLVNDVLDWDVLGARLYVKPLGGSETSAMGDLEFGASAMFDFDPLQEYTSVDTGPPRDNSASVTVSTFGVDAGFPLIKNEKVDLITYVDWAIILGKGNGVSVGTDFRYSWATFYAQLRFLGERFVPRYFDPFYWVERPFKYDSLDLITDPYFGYLAGTDLDIYNVVTFYFYWEDGLIEPIKPRIRTGIMLNEEAVRKVRFHFTYDKKNITSFNDFIDLNDSLFEFLFEYRVTDFASIAFIQAQSFAPWTKSVSQTYVETRFRF